MKTNRKIFYRVSAIVVFVLASLLIIFLIWRQRANQDVLIEREKAIQNAIEACNPSYGLRPVEQPTEFQAELTTYGSTLNQKPTNYQGNPADLAKPVWVVKMKGRWILVSGPVPDPSKLGPAYWDECTIVIDAQTGESLSRPIE